MTPRRPFAIRTEDDARAADKVARVQEWAEELSDQALACRTYGHGSNMRPFTVRRYKAEGKPTVYYRIVLRCKCKVRRVMYATASAKIVSSHYDYSHAPGYPTSGIGRLVGEERDVVRLEGFTRFITTHPEEEEE